MADATLRTIESNGIKMRIAEQGEGPLVLLLHGWPESWYSWRHQLAALAAAGYHAVAPDQRGYGGTDAPAAIEAYNILELTADAVGVLDALGQRTAVVVGHDWGAQVAWHCALLHPDRFPAVAALSVPYNGRPPMAPISLMRAMADENFFYILYFQEPGVAEAEFEADVPRTMRMILAGIGGGGDTDLAAMSLPKTAKFLDQMRDPGKLPAWLTKEDHAYFSGEFQRTGFRGGLNWYRNFDRNWELTPQLAGAKVEQPALYITGERDPVKRFAPATSMGANVPNLRKTVEIPGVGHWTQQEAPERVNEELNAFIRGLA